MSGNGTYVDCSPLVERRDFDSYIAAVLNVTAGNLHQLIECRAEVCIALWGQGNPDVSGIGMLVGYVLEHILGLALALAFLLRATTKVKPNTAIWTSTFQSFHDCATFLAFSIQIAAMVVLIKVDFGISTEGMGDATVRITQAVSALTLLPLVYGVVLLRVPITQAEVNQDANRDEQPASLNEARRFIIFVVCWVLSVYPFYSKVNSVFGQSKIANPTSGQPQPSITVQQFQVIEAICFKGVQPISSPENRLMPVFAFLSFIPLSVLVLGRIVFLGRWKHHSESKLYTKFSANLDNRAGTMLRHGAVAFLGFIPVLSCGLLWTVVRVQRFQDQLALASGAKGGGDGEWTFGQVVAVTVFAPVFVETWFQCRSLWISWPSGTPDHTGVERKIVAGGETTSLRSAMTI